MKFHKYILALSLSLFFVCSNGMEQERPKNPLIEAAASHQEELVQKLLAENVDVNAQDRLGNTALSVAASRGNSIICKMLLDSGAQVGLANKDGLTSLHVAVMSGNIDVVTLLIDRGADVNAQDSYRGRTPLLWAVRMTQGSVKKKRPQMSVKKATALIKLLLSKGADPMLQDLEGKTALYWARKLKLEPLVFILTPAKNQAAKSAVQLTKQKYNPAREQMPAVKIKAEAQAPVITPASQEQGRYETVSESDDVFTTDLAKLRTESGYEKYKRDFLDRLSRDRQLAIINGGTSYLITDRTLITNHLDKNVYLWSPGVNEFDCIFSPDLKRIATANRAVYRVRLFENKPFGFLLPFASFDQQGGVAFSPDGLSIATADAAYGGIRLWKNEPSNHPQSIAWFNHGEQVQRIIFSPNGKMIAAIIRDRVALWNIEHIEHPTLFATLPNQNYNDPCAIRFSPDSKMIVTTTRGGMAGKISIWNIIENKEPKLVSTFQTTWAQKLMYAGLWNIIAFSPDGRQIVLGSTYGYIELWDITKIQQPQLLTMFKTQTSQATGEVTAITFSPDGKLIATGSRHELSLWRNQPNMNLQPLIKHEGLVDAIAFTPDDKIMVAAYGGVKLWQLIDLNRLDLATAQIVVYIIKNDIKNLVDLPEYLKRNLNPYATEFLFPSTPPSTSWWYQRAWDWAKEKVLNNI